MLSWVESLHGAREMTWKAVDGGVFFSGALSTFFGLDPSAALDAPHPIKRPQCRRHATNNAPITVSARDSSSPTQGRRLFRRHDRLSPINSHDTVERYRHVQHDVLRTIIIVRVAARRDLYGFNIIIIFKKTKMIRMMLA